MSSTFDRELAKRLSRALETGDLRDQASRVMSMMGAVNQFVDTITQAEIAVRSIRTKRSELEQLKRNRDPQPEDTQKIAELEQDIHEGESLDRQLQKSRQDIRQLQTAAENLYRTLNRLR